MSRAKDKRRQKLRRCSSCGTQLTGADLWMFRYATTVPLSIRKHCSKSQVGKDNDEG
jgi:hypothetical protein